MKITCIAIDDEPLALRQISDFIQQCGLFDLVGQCQNAYEALEILNQRSVDLMFVDINMPGLSGLDFIKSLSSKPEVIFTTAYSEFAVEGFKVDALDYLLKPIGYDAFLKAANKATAYFSLKANSNPEVQSDEHLFVKADYKVHRIAISDIKYIEGMREYVRIYLENAKPIMSLMSMKSLEERLSGESFMRVHRSFIVNLKKITTIERNRIIFDKEVFIPVSDQHKEKFQAYIDKYFL